MTPIWQTDTLALAMGVVLMILLVCRAEKKREEVRNEY